MGERAILLFAAAVAGLLLWVATAVLFAALYLAPAYLSPDLAPGAAVESAVHHGPDIDAPPLIGGMHRAHQQHTAEPWAPAI